MLSEGEIQIFSKAIARLFEEAREVELHKPLAEVQERIAAVISSNMNDERKLNADCDKVMDPYAREIEKGSMDPHKVFLMIKRKLAKERGFVL